MTSLGYWDIIGSSGAVCIHTFQLPDDRLLCVERPHERPYPQNINTNGIPATEIRLKNDAGEWKASFQPVPMASNAFCSGHAMLGNGSILNVGGDARIDTGLQDGRNNIRIYNPCQSGTCSNPKGEFSEVYQMSTQRWYPTIVTLADGSAMIISGSTDNLDFSMLDRPIQNPTYEYYPPKSTGVWPQTLEILQWAWPFDLYPMAFQMPSGNIFLFVSNKSIIINPKTDQIYSTVPDLVVDKHHPFIYPYTPNMVLLPLTKKNNYKATVLICGGSDKGVNDAPVSSQQCYKISPEDPSSKWERQDDMPVGRVMPDSIILPDGKVLFVNGAGWGLAGGQGGDAQNAGNPVFETSLYDPEAPTGQKWSSLPKSSVPRLYHSGVILTPDGFVVTTGSEMSNYVDLAGPNANPDCFPNGARRVCTDPYEYRIERYTPYYLTNGKERPVIINAPTKLTYNSSFLIEVPKGTKISKASFIRFSTTTHSTNTDQRFVELEIIGMKGNLVGLRAPVDGALAPPGNWMLFILTDGTPSIAKVINLQSGDQTDFTLDLISGSSKMSFPLILGIMAVGYLIV